MKCIKCQGEVQEGYKVCPYCGAKMVKNPVICPSCNNVVCGDYEICSECGKRLDGKKVCPHCGSIVEDDFKFCPMCAKEIDVVDTKKEKVIKVSKSENNSSRFTDFKKMITSPYYVIKVSGKALITLFATLIFIFSMCKTSTIEMDLDSVLVSEMYTIDEDVSIWDTLGATFTKKDYNDADFEKEYYRAVAEYEYRTTNSESFYDSIDAMEEFLEEVNPLKYLKAEMNETNGATMNPHLIIRSVIGVLTIVASFGFLVYSALDLYKAIRGENLNKKNLMAFEFLIIGAFVLMCAFEVNLGIAVVKNSGLAIAMLIIACVSVVIKFGLNIYQDCQEGKENFIISGLSIIKSALATVAICLCFSSITTITYASIEKDAKNSQMIMEYNMVDYLSYELLEKGDYYNKTSDKESVSEYDEYIEAMVRECSEVGSYLCEDSEAIKLFVNPHTMANKVKTSALQQDINTDVFIVAAFVNLTAAIFLVIYIYLELSGAKKGNKIATYVVALNLVVIGFILNINANNHYFDIITNLKMLSIREVSVANVGDVLRVVFAGVLLFGEIGESIICGDRKKVEYTIVDDAAN